MNKELVYKIELAIDQMKRNAEQAKQSADNFHKSFQENTKKTNGAWDSFVGNLSAQVFMDVARGIFGLGKSAVDSAKDLEVMESQFATLTGSMESSKALMQELIQFGATTPFELKGITTTARTLLSFGFTAGEVTQKLQFLGDIASTSGSSLQEIGTIFGQVSAAGKLTGERLLQLQERGIPVLSQLATNLGTTEAAVSKMVTDGKIKFEDFSKAMASMAQEGGFAFGGMERQSQTLAGKLSNLTDAKDQLMTKLGTYLIPAMKTAVDTMISMANSAQNLITWMEKNEDVVLAVGAAVGTLAAGTLLYIGYLKIAANWTAITTAATTALNIAMRATPYGLIITGISAVVGALVYMSQNLEETKLKFYEASIYILKSIEPLETGFRTVFGTILQIWGHTYGTIIQTAIDLGGKFASIFGIELPDSMVNFKDNILATASAFKNGGGAIAGQIAELEAKAKSIKDVLAKGEAPTAPTDAGGNSKPVMTKEQIAAENARQEELKRIAAYQAQIELMNINHKNNMFLADEEANVARLEWEAQNEALSLEQRLAKEEEALTAKQAFELKKLEIEKQAALASAELEKTEEDKAKKRLEAMNTYELKKKKELNKQKLEDDKLAHKTKMQLDEAERQRMNQTLSVTADFLGGVAGLLKKSSKEQKAVSTAQAIISTYLAANQAYAAMSGIPVVGPALGAAAAATAIMRGIANVKQINSAGNYAEGGMVPGASVAGDKLTAGVNSGELILNRAMQDSVATDLTNRTQGMEVLAQKMDILIDVLVNRPMVLVADDIEIARSASRGVISGVEIGRTV